MYASDDPKKFKNFLKENDLNIKDRNDLIKAINYKK